jgi:hypothetical protein
MWNTYGSDMTYGEFLWAISSWSEPEINKTPIESD